MKPDIESQLRAHLQRKLKILNGKGQITVRRLVKCLKPKNGNGFKYAEDSVLRNKQMLHALAAELCEAAGGRLSSTAAYCRSKSHGSVASRVYQF